MADSKQAFDRESVHWRRSSRCDTNACVEVAVVGGNVVVRDSADPDGPVLSFPRAQWRAFIDGIKDGIDGIEDGKD